MRRSLGLTRLTLWGLALALLLVACGRSEAPREEESETASEQPRLLGFVDTALSDSALSDSNTLPGAIISQSLVEGLQVRGVALSSDDVIDQDGERIINARFIIDNASGAALDNLTLYALITPESLAGTGLKNVRDSSGALVSGIAAVRSVVPIHATQAGSSSVDMQRAAFQAFSREEIEAEGGIQAQVQALEPDWQVLDYGFVALNPDPGLGADPRRIPNGGQAEVTLAFRYPYDGDAQQVHSFSLQMALASAPISRFSRSPQESLDALEQRILSFYGGVANVPAELEVVLDNADNADFIAIAPTVLRVDLAAFKRFETTLVSFVDAELEAFVRSALGRDEGDLSDQDMLELITLNASAPAEGGNIRRLEGLEFAENLRVLDIARHQLDDLSLLAGLSRLEELNLNSNAISDISPLAELRALRDLNLNRNAVADVTALEQLPQLSLLGLDDNVLQDITPLAANAAFGEASIISLFRNCLDLSEDSASSQAIAALQARDVTMRVSPQEPEKCLD